MKEGKKVLSVQVDADIIDKLKDISAVEKRSQAKTLEVLIEEKYKKIIDLAPKVPFVPKKSESQRLNLAEELAKLK
jgi:hypothetical protein